MQGRAVTTQYVVAIDYAVTLDCERMDNICDHAAGSSSIITQCWGRNFADCRQLCYGYPSKEAARSAVVRFSNLARINNIVTISYDEFTKGQKNERFIRSGTFAPEPDQPTGDSGPGSEPA